jgi:hypothetical protein
VKLLAIGRPRPGVDARAAIAPHAEEELRALWALYRDGLVREAYSPGAPGVVLTVEAASSEAANERLAELPLVRSAIIEFELIELRPFAAFEQLFTNP